ncbi:VAC1 protein [Sodiomyces alkalinus F11]|uniref:VAC1 protein n=1 Tax=Sodiomyces alkalinus (strain CBS 110278 / VKM F-3762 / F11) TaxID=1314773 RepID=A0A3N2PNM9_SODAK|nr:VAC1 protein [Sodiomyces alkalinus F11]ROT36128.1 VAC1 protein [Sodiomyces alkalinus F11]
MSSRKLGGGRILGSGKGLAPPVPSAAPQRAPSPIAPSDSTLSINSSSASPPVSNQAPEFVAQDLTSRISLDNPSLPEASSTKLICPICEEEMLTLLQLNRHIDDAHQELAEVEQDEVRTWFDKQVRKAKRFQPLSIINQKLRGLDVFESNESIPPPHPSHSKAIVEAPVDPDELITRSHWQRQTINDRCTDPLCGKGLGPVNGSVNCRSCGRLFCEEHTMYQMKLSRSAQHEPVRGFWARVCETCYKSREGYNDHNGVLIDHTDAFVAMRRERVERQNLETSRLEKRLTRLTSLLANPPEELPATNGTLSVASLTGQKNARKLLEQSVVTWEDDASVSQCPFCQQEFRSWTFRRHHCRICGRVVCADPRTACSTELGLSVASSATSTTEKPFMATTPTTSGQLNIDIRMCRACNHTIFSKRDFAASLAFKPADQRAYETLRQFERGIRQLMPVFQRTLLALQPEGSQGFNEHHPPPTHAQIQEASKVRKRLVDAFTKYDTAARRLRDLKTTSKTQLKLQQAIYSASSTFLHTHMLTLKSVPHVLRSRSSQSSQSRLLALQHQSSNGSASSSSSSSWTQQQQQQSLSPLRRNGEHAADTASQAESEASTQVSALETEEKELRERLIVLEEQQFMVRQMVEAARGARRFEEVSALTRNADELEAEIEEVRRQVGEVEKKWQGLYA